jgi:Acyl-CoA reductase (LuxC)
MLSAADVERTAAALIGARARILLARPIGTILKSLAETVEAWLRPESRFRRDAEVQLPAATGFSVEMIRHGLPLLLGPLRGDAIGRLLDTELGSREAVDQMTTPPLILHVLSGNIPALAATSLSLSLAVKSAAMLKISHGDRFFPPRFIESLSQVDADLAECAAAIYWPGGRLDLEATAFAASNVVVASGSDTTIADIERHVPGRFIGYGHRMSFALVAREAMTDTEEIVRRLAYDVCLWDQQGCLSPQLVYVERGGVVAVEQFAFEIGRQLERFSQQLPARALSVQEEVEIQRFRQEAEWRAVRGEEVILFASPGGMRWSVVYDAKPAFTPTPLNRTIWVKPIDSIAELPGLLQPVRQYLEAAGLAASAGRRLELEALLVRSGVHRVCPLGEMQRPDLTWRQGGRPRVAAWIE